MEIRSQEIKHSKIVNISNSCAFDILTFWINLVPTKHGVKILKLMEPNLKNAIIELTRQLYTDSSTSARLQARLHQINQYVKAYYNVPSFSFLSIDDMLFDNEALLESGFITETADDFKDISIQIVNVNKVHYLIKILIRNADNTLRIIYIDDLPHSTIDSVAAIPDEQVVLVCNTNIDEMDALFEKIKCMCK